MTRALVLLMVSCSIGIGLCWLVLLALQTLVGWPNPVTVSHALALYFLAALGIAARMMR